MNAIDVIQSVTIAVQGVTIVALAAAHLRRDRRRFVTTVLINPEGIDEDEVVRAVERAMRRKGRAL